jgi:membrane-associated protein
VGGALLWVGLLVYGGYFFGNLPWVKDNLSKVIVGIIVISVMPGVIEWWRNRR